MRLTEAQQIKVIENTAYARGYNDGRNEALRENTINRRVKDMEQIVFGFEEKLTQEDLKTYREFEYDEAIHEIAVQESLKKGEIE